MKKILLLLSLFVSASLNSFKVKNCTDNDIAVFYVSNEFGIPEKYMFSPYAPKDKEDAGIVYVKPNSQIQMKIENEAESIWFVDDKFGKRSVGDSAHSLNALGLGLHAFDWKRQEEIKTDCYKALQEDNLVIQIYYQDNPDWLPGEKRTKRLNCRFTKSK